MSSFLLKFIHNKCCWSDILKQRSAIDTSPFKTYVPFLDEVTCSRRSLLSAWAHYHLCPLLTVSISHLTWLVFVAFFFFLNALNCLLGKNFINITYISCSGRAQAGEYCVISRPSGKNHQFCTGTSDPFRDQDSFCLLMSAYTCGLVWWSMGC